MCKCRANSSIVTNSQATFLSDINIIHLFFVDVELMKLQKIGTCINLAREMLELLLQKQIRFFLLLMIEYLMLRRSKVVAVGFRIWVGAGDCVRLHILGCS